MIGLSAPAKSPLTAATATSVGTLAPSATAKKRGQPHST